MDFNDLHTNFEVRDLIKLVRDHPIIYDASRTDFKNIEKKENVWLQISSVIFLTPEECRRRWRTLRERFTRELKRHKFYGEESCWEYFKDLQFLKPYIRCRSSRYARYRGKDVNRRPAKEPSDDSSASWTNKLKLPSSPQAIAMEELKVEVDRKSDYYEELFVERLDERLEETFAEPLPTPIKLTKLTHHNDHSYNEPQTPLNSSSLPNNPNDEDGLFCESIAYSLRRLNRLNNIKAKVEIFKVLERLIEREEQQGANKV